MQLQKSERFARARKLKVRKVGDGFRVTGGTATHELTLNRLENPVCKCHDKRWRRPKWCKHEIAVLMFMRRLTYK